VNKPDLPLGCNVVLNLFLLVVLAGAAAGLGFLVSLPALLISVEAYLLVAIAISFCAFVAFSGLFIKDSGESPSKFGMELVKQDGNRFLSTVFFVREALSGGPLTKNPTTEMLSIANTLEALHQLLTYGGVGDVDLRTRLLFLRFELKRYAKSAVFVAKWQAERSLISALRISAPDALTKIEPRGHSIVEELDDVVSSAVQAATGEN
jgi:hypothetical protein